MSDLNTLSAEILDLVDNEHDTFEAKVLTLLFKVKKCHLSEEPEKSQLGFFSACHRLIEKCIQEDISLAGVKQVTMSLMPVCSSLTCKKSNFFYSFYAMFWNESCRISATDQEKILYFRTMSLSFLSRCDTSQLQKLSERFLYVIQTINEKNLDHFGLLFDGSLKVLEALCEKLEGTGHEFDVSIEEVCQSSKLILLFEMSLKCLQLKAEMFPELTKKYSLYFDKKDLYWDIFICSPKVLSGSDSNMVFTKWIYFCEILPSDNYVVNVSLMAVGKLFIGICQLQTEEYAIGITSSFCLLRMLKKLYSVLPLVQEKAVKVFFQDKVSAFASILRTALFFIQKVLSLVNSQLENSDINLIAFFRQSAITLVRQMKLGHDDKKLDESLLYVVKVLDTFLWRFAVMLYNTKCNYDAAAMLMTASCCDTLELLEFKTEEEKKKAALQERLQSIYDCRLRSKNHEKLYGDLSECLCAALTFDNQEFLNQILNLMARINIKLGRQVSTLDLLRMNDKIQWTSSDLANLILREISVYEPNRQSNPCLSYLARQLLDLNYSSYTSAFGKILEVSILWLECRSQDWAEDLKKGVHLTDEVIMLLESDKEGRFNGKNMVLLIEAYIWKFWCMKGVLEIEAEVEVKRVESLLTKEVEQNLGDEKEESSDIAAGFSFLSISKENGMFSYLETALEYMMSPSIKTRDVSTSYLKLVMSTAYAFGAAGRIIQEIKAWEVLMNAAVDETHNAIFLEAVIGLLHNGVLPDDEILNRAQKIADIFAMDSARKLQTLAARFDLSQAWTLYYMKQYSASMSLLQKVLNNKIVGRDANRTKTICLVLADAHCLESQLLSLDDVLLYENCEPYLPNLIGPLEASKNCVENALQVLPMYKLISEKQGWEFVGQQEMLLGVLFQTVIWRINILNRIGQPLEVIHVGKAALFYAQVNGLAVRTVELLNQLALCDLMMEDAMNSVVKIQAVLSILEDGMKSFSNSSAHQLASQSVVSKKHIKGEDGYISDELLRNFNLKTKLNEDAVVHTSNSPSRLRNIPKKVELIFSHSRNCKCPACDNLLLLMQVCIFNQIVARTQMMLNEFDCEIIKTENLECIIEKVAQLTEFPLKTSNLFHFSEECVKKTALLCIDTILEHAIIYGFHKQYKDVKLHLYRVTGIMSNLKGSLCMLLGSILEKYEALLFNCEMDASSTDEIEAVAAGIQNLNVDDEFSPHLKTPSRISKKEEAHLKNAPRRRRKEEAQNIIDEWSADAEFDKEFKRRNLLSDLKFQLPPETPVASKKEKIRVYAESGDTEILTQKKDDKSRKVLNSKVMRIQGRESRKVTTAAKSIEIVASSCTTDSPERIPARRKATRNIKCSVDINYKDEKAKAANLNSDISRLDITKSKRSNRNATQSLETRSSTDETCSNVSDKSVKLIATVSGASKFPKERNQSEKMMKIPTPCLNSKLLKENRRPEPISPLLFDDSDDADEVFKAPTSSLKYPRKKELELVTESKSPTKESEVKGRFKVPKPSSKAISSEEENTKETNSPLLFEDSDEKDKKHKTSKCALKSYRGKTTSTVTRIKKDERKANC
ncbi:uncharacterized protein LOC136041797 [Artemia franciscana]|uniref:Separase n=1 Tax=Artemia franciscana TaxID=6661 RepID=A0AA88H7I8_ARTSF|nr:hypothetical protein QYM36_018067 [Artemia franciscana]